MLMVESWVEFHLVTMYKAKVIQSSASGEIQSLKYCGLVCGRCTVLCEVEEVLSGLYGAFLSVDCAPSRLAWRRSGGGRVGGGGVEREGGLRLLSCFPTCYLTKKKVSAVSLVHFTE